MSRPLRLEMPNGVFHITNRGLERRDIVRDDHDRRTWFRLLNSAATRHGWRIYAYVLLDNHFHLYLRTPQPNLSAGMHNFESGYAALFNRRHERVGPLLQGRFHAVLVEHDSHAWELSRYVHLNPVRARLIDDPGNYVWSSCRYYLNPHSSPKWLDWRSVLADFAGTEAAARLAYRRFVLAGIATPPSNPFDKANDGWLLGSPAFCERVLQAENGLEASPMAGARWAVDLEMSARPRSGLLDRAANASLSIDSILLVVAELTSATVAQMRGRGRHGNRARDAAILLCRDLLSEPLDVLCVQFGDVTRSAITETVRRARDRCEREPAFKALVESARVRLTGVK